MPGVFHEFACGIYKKDGREVRGSIGEGSSQKNKNIYMFKARLKGRVHGAWWLRIWQWSQTDERPSPSSSMYELTSSERVSESPSNSV